MTMSGSQVTKRVLSWGLFTLMAACASANPINVGSNDGGGNAPTDGSGGHGGGGPGPAPDDTDACRNGVQLPIVGVWEGYIENFRFASGSDAIHLAVTSATSAQACGKVTLGKGTPPPPPTDPEVGYPPGYLANGPFSVSEFFTIDRTEGFPLSIVAGAADSARFKFGADWHEFWQAWCALQPPQAFEDNSGFGCIGAMGGSTSDQGCASQIGGQLVPLDCGKLQLCLGNMCKCTMTSCRVERTSRWAFDLRITDDQAAGSVRTDMGVGDGEIHNVYLTRTK